MEIWLYLAGIILGGTIVGLVLKLRLLKKAALEIKEAFQDRVHMDTNTLIDLSSNDPSMRELANVLNAELRKLRAERHRFQQGNSEIQQAIINISHDLRTPLTAMLGYLELLETIETTKEAQRYIGIVKNRAEILTQLTEELFDYSTVITKKQAIEVQPVNVKSVLEESLSAFYLALQEQKITPNIQMPKQDVIRTLDPVALLRVFSNLLSNVIKYSDGDLEITLSEEGEIVFCNTANELDKVQVAQLFHRFYTVDTTRKSTGLGLAISRSLIEEMNGTIMANYENSRLSIRLLLPDR